MRKLTAMRPESASEPASALIDLAAALRDEDTVISEHVREPTERPILAPFVALGPRCEASPGEYGLVIESIREGYLLHYGTPRILAGLDSDLALLAGDHMYALGLERLAGLGDLEAVRELADLISLCAQIAAETAGDEATNALWLACATAIATGGTSEHDAAKAALRRGDEAAPSLLWAAARSGASAAGIAAVLDEAAEAIESRADGSS
jgi:hypothetical protein